MLLRISVTVSCLTYGAHSSSARLRKRLRLKGSSIWDHLTEQLFPDVAPFQLPRLLTPLAKPRSFPKRSYSLFLIQHLLDTIAFSSPLKTKKSHKHSGISFKKSAIAEGLKQDHFHYKKIHLYPCLKAAFRKIKKKEKQYWFQKKADIWYKLKSTSSSNIMVSNFNLGHFVLCNKLGMKLKLLKVCYVPDSWGIQP